MPDFLDTTDFAFLLNGVAMDGLRNVTPPSIGKQVREVSTLGDVYPVFESSKLAVDSDFSVEVRKISGSLPQNALLNHLASAEVNGTAVSESQFRITVAAAVYLSGSCLPLPAQEWAQTEFGIETPMITFNFKKQKLATTVINI